VDQIYKGPDARVLEMQGDDVDWKGFTDGVMSQLTPEKLPLFTRLKLALGEMFTYQRGPLIAGMGGAAHQEAGWTDIAPLSAVPRTLEWTAFALAAASVLLGLRGVELMQLVGVGP
jgi:hypothetical protein